MNEEKARHYAKALARGMGITFYVVRSREGRYLSVHGHRTTAKFSRLSRHLAACTTPRNSAE